MPMNCTDSAVQLTISDQFNKEACRRQKKSLKRIFKGGKIAIGFLNSKSEKAYHWGVKAYFSVKKVFLFFKNWVCRTFSFLRERQKQVWLMEWNGISLSCVE
jgi:hypothetical protein